MRYLVRLFLIALLIINNSCRKDGNEDPDTIIFKGITQTDALGVIISRDSSDWRMDDSWIDIESKLFAETSAVLCNGNDQYAAIAYPNPSNGSFNLHLSRPGNATCAIRIVDQDFHTLFAQDSVLLNDMHFSLQDFQPNDSLIRIYYKFHGEECEMRGHGDIRIEQKK